MAAKFLSMVFVVACVAASAFPQTTSFTYQGRLTDAGNPANGGFQMQFRLYDASAGGTQIGATLADVPVTSIQGIFSVRLDFGAGALSGANRWLEISVRHNSSEAYATLNPREQIASSPYAVRTISAAMADDSQKLGGVDASQYVTTATVGSSFVRNGTTAQTADFNINGNGVVGGDLTVGGALSLNIVNAQTQYNLGGTRILSNPGQRNLFAGESAGQSDVSNGSNAFFGYRAGMSNTVGVRNNFFGSVAGERNTTGFDNNFFGDSAGRFNTSGSRGSYFGSYAGENNTSGSDNSFFGYQAGRNNTGIGGANSFFGSNSGFLNTSGLYNSYFGYFSGTNTTTGAQNTFIGSSAGEHNYTGSYNTFVGYAAGDNIASGDNNTALGFAANVSSGLVYGTVIGSNAVVSQNNSIVLGRQGLDSVGIAIPNPARTLDVNGRARVRSIPLEASGAAVCFNAVGDLLQCGASSLRFKRNVRPFDDGLDIVLRLRPISFDWKEDGRSDLGLGAEDVARVAPSFVFKNDKGEARGVRYEKLNLLLINAVQELSAENRRLQERLARLERRMRRSRR